MVEHCPLKSLPARKKPPPTHSHVGFAGRPVGTESGLAGDWSDFDELRFALI